MQVDQIPAPDMGTSILRFKPLHIESPHSFWIEYAESEQQHVNLKNLIERKIDQCLILKDFTKLKVTQTTIL